MMVASRLLFGLAFAGYLASALLYVARLALNRAVAVRAPLAGAAVGGAFRVSLPALAVTVTAVPAPAEVGVQSSAAAPDRWAPMAYGLAAAAVLLQGAGIGVRWLASGQAPMSNLYEYMSLTGWSIMLCFVWISHRYRLPALGAFVAPVGIIIIAYASVFPSDVSPLVPALQSYWLVLHVSLAALGEGAFAVSFAAAVMFLLRARQDRRLPWEERALEFLAFLVAVLVGFTVLALLTRWSGYSVTLAGAAGQAVTYHLPPLVGPAGAAPGSAGSLAGLPLPFWQAPAFLQGVAAARKLSTLLLSLAMGGMLYGLARLAVGKPLRDVGTRAVTGLRPAILDEISYRAVAAGFPIFTLGALVFAMIWAQKAWGSYWSWDPKETWALISWLFYAGYLHQRIVRGWEGRPAAWTAVAGFVVILFTLVGVNLLVSGLHSYAGG